MVYLDLDVIYPYVDNALNISQICFIADAMVLMTQWL